MACNSPPVLSTKRKTTDSHMGRSKRVQGSTSPPTSDTEESNCSDSEVPREKGPSPLRPPTPSSPPKYPSDLKTHHCPYSDCPKSFNRPARLTEHLRSHTNERPFHCKQPGCDKEFRRETHLSHHVKSAHTNVRDYICEWEGCGKQFLTATRLRRHHAAHEGREKYRCTQHQPCNETFRKHSTLQKHIASVHLKQKPYPCTQLDKATGQPCTHGFETAGKLRAHEGRIHGGARFWCSECSDASPEAPHDPLDQTQRHRLGFPTYALLQAHIRTAHPPVCTSCHQPCATPRDLKQHVEIYHDGRTLSERKTHLCTHADCDRAFTKKGNLAVHIRTVHEGEKRFVCGEADLRSSKGLEDWDAAADGACGARFTAKGNLEEHMRTVHLHLPGRSRASRRSSLTLAAKEGKQKPLQPSALSRLTGAGYDADSGRHIVCPEAECAYRFFRTYDLELHLRSHHGLGLLGGSSRIPTDGSGRLVREDMNAGIRAGEGYVDKGDEAAEKEVCGAFARDVEAELERMAGLGGEFWVGGLGSEGVDKAVDEAVEEAVMWEGEGEEETIDPVLRYLEVDAGVGEV